MKKAPLTVVIAVLAAVAGAVTLGRTLRHPSALADMRATVAELRASADSCRAELDNRHDALLRYNERLDSMRGRVRDLEALHPRGVPADSYDIYMGAFSRYNDSAAAWDARVEAVQAELESCRAIADAHNAALDSLRRLLQQSGR